MDSRADSGPTGRAVPYNIEAEEAILGSLLIDPDAITRVAPILRGEDFYRRQNGLIYQAILDLHERREPTDLVMVCDELEKHGQLEKVDGDAYLISLMNAVPTPIHAEHYARVVERDATLRRLIQAAGEIAGLAYDGSEEEAEILDRAEQRLFAVSQRRLTRDFRPISSVLSQVYDQIEERYQHRGEMVGIPTGFADLDKLLGGLQPADLIIIAGRPGMGKTSLALSILRHATIKHKLCSALFSMEMSAEQVVQRLISAESGIDSQRLRMGEIQESEWESFARAGAILSEVPIFIDDTPAISPLEIRTKSRRVHAEHGLQLVVVDYLQLMGGGGRTENRVQEISQISRSLKALAMELRLPVIALSQLSRATEARQPPIPRLSDLRESGSIEQDADVVLMIYRDEMYNEDSDRKGLADIEVAKHRNGPTGKVQLYFAKQVASFADAEIYRQPEGY